jgi:hypothetical protein
MPSEDLDLQKYCRKWRASLSEQLMEVEVWLKVVRPESTIRRPALLDLRETLQKFIQQLDDLDQRLD